MDVLILAKHDWANTGYRFYKCLRHLGLDILMLKGAFHPFCYPEQAPIHPVLASLPNNDLIQRAPGLKQFTELSEVVHFIASTFIDTGTDFIKKKVVMQHGGKAYREQPEALNEIYNQVVNKTVIQSPDLLGYGANDETWIYYPVDTDFIQPNFTTNKKLVVGHFPSIPKHKGTVEIVQVIEKLEKDDNLKKRFEYVGARSPELFLNNGGLIMWTDNLKRMAKCDIIIETMLPEVQNHKFGEWGNTALEASAMGNICITNSLARDRYEEEFGHLPLWTANDASELELELRKVFAMTTKEIMLEKQVMRTWVEEFHSIPATAQRLWDKVYSELL